MLQSVPSLLRGRRLGRARLRPRGRPCRRWSACGRGRRGRAATTGFPNLLVADARVLPARGLRVVVDEVAKGNGGDTQCFFRATFSDIIFTYYLPVLGSNLESHPGGRGPFSLAIAVSIFRSLFSASSILVLWRAAAFPASFPWLTERTEKCALR